MSGHEPTPMPSKCLIAGGPSHLASGTCVSRGERTAKRLWSLGTESGNGRF